MKLRSTRFILLAMLGVGVAGLATLFAQSATPQVAPASPKLIVGVNTARFFALLGARPSTWTVGGNNITYTVLPWQQGNQGEKTKIGSGVEISVFPSARIAHESFAGRLCRQVGPSRTNGVGDEFYCWHSETYYIGSPNPEQGTFLLRRRNVVIEVGYRGSLKEMIEVARRIDKALDSDDALAPKGEHFATPEVQLTVPPRITVGERFRINLSSSAGSPVRISEISGYYGTALVTTAKFYRTAPPQPGPFEIEMPLMTEDNVAFTEKVTVQVMPNSLESAPGLHEWPLPFDTFLFKPDVKVAYRQVPLEKHEWMYTVPSTQGSFKDDAESKLREQGLQEKALQEWSGFVKPEWLPQWSMIKVGPEFEAPAPPKYNARCSVAYPNAKMVFLGVIGKSLWLYVEQPWPLPPGSVALSAANIIRPEILQNLPVQPSSSINLHCPDVLLSNPGPRGVISPQGGIAQQTFDRYRAFELSGPYNHVRILMIRLDFPKPSN